MPDDALCKYFVKACAELHLMGVQKWMEDETKTSLAIDDIAYLINIMRVGANYVRYLQYKKDKTVNQEELSLP